MQPPEITFAGSDFDRAAALRTDTAQLQTVFESAQARFVPLWQHQCLVEDSRVALVPADELPTAPALNACVLLGRRAEQWLFGITLDTPTEPSLGAGRRFVELRAVMGELTPGDAALAAYARAMLMWHERHAYCGLCGAPNLTQEGGFVMACSRPGCEHRSFPRLDPAVIVLVHGGEECLLGRQPTWPEDRYSTIAGFVEPGEGLEDALRREVLEETNIRVGDVQYFASQPWPFPAALMIGFHAAALSRDIRLNDGELADARWISRQQIAERQVTLPPRTSVAFRLIESWFDAGGVTLRELGIEGPPLRLRR